MAVLINGLIPPGVPVGQARPIQITFPTALNGGVIQTYTCAELHPAVAPPGGFPTAFQTIHQVATPSRFSTNGSWRVMIQDGWKYGTNSGERSEMSNYPDNRAGDSAETSTMALSSPVTLPTSTIPVKAWTGPPINQTTLPSTIDQFDPSGTIYVYDQPVQYTGKSGNNFTGCSGGTGTFPATNTHVHQGHTRWYAFSFWLSTTSGEAWVGSGWNNIFQYKSIIGVVQASPSVSIQPMGGTAMRLDVLGGRFLASGDQQYNNVRDRTGTDHIFMNNDPAFKGRWVDVMMQVKFDWTFNGFVKVWWKFSTDTYWGRRRDGTDGGVDFVALDSSGGLTGTGTSAAGRHPTTYNTLATPANQNSLPIANGCGSNINTYRGDGATASEAWYTPGLVVAETRADIDALYGLAASPETVTFSGIPASFVRDSATQITATVPTGATTGRIQVTTPDGTATSSIDFTVGATPPSSLPDPAANHLRIGNATLNPLTTAIGRDYKRVIKRGVGAGATVTIDKGYAYLVGPTSGGLQRHRVVIYDDDAAGGLPGTFKGMSDETTVALNASGQWVAFTFSTPVLVSGDQVYFGLWEGGLADGRVGYTSVVGAGWLNAEIYTLGPPPSNPFGSANVIGIEPSIVVDYLTTTDTQAPSVLNAVVSEQTLSVLYDEALDPAHVPTISAFNVTVNQQAVTLSTVALSGASAQMTLASPVSFGDIVTIAYTAPVSDAEKLQDVFANKAASYGTMNVTNQTQQTPAGRRVSPASRVAIARRVDPTDRRAGEGGGL